MNDLQQLKHQIDELTKFNVIADALKQIASGQMIIKKRQANVSRTILDSFRFMTRRITIKQKNELHIFVSCDQRFCRLFLRPLNDYFFRITEALSGQGEGYEYLEFSSNNIPTKKVFDKPQIANFLDGVSQYINQIKLEKRNYKVQNNEIHVLICGIQSHKIAQSIPEDIDFTKRRSIANFAEAYDIATESMGFGQPKAATTSEAQAPRSERTSKAQAEQSERTSEAQAPRSPSEAQAPRSPSEAQAPRSERTSEAQAPRSERTSEAQAPRSERTSEAQAPRSPSEAQAPRSERTSVGKAPRTKAFDEIYIHANTADGVVSYKSGFSCSLQPVAHLAQEIYFYANAASAKENEVRMTVMSEAADNSIKEAQKAKSKFNQRRQASITAAIMLTS